MTPLAIAQLLFALETFPTADLRAAIAHPSPAAIVELAADVASAAASVNPHAKLAALGLTAAAFMLRHPSNNPVAEAQTHLGRGGRRS